MVPLNLRSQDRRLSYLLQLRLAASHSILHGQALHLLLTPRSNLKSSICSITQSFPEAEHSSTRVICASLNLNSICIEGAENAAVPGVFPLGLVPEATITGPR